MKNLTRVLGLSIVLIFVTCTGFAQKNEKGKCKYDINKTDEFTGKPIKSIYMALYYGNFILTFSKEDTVVTLLATIKINGSKVEPLKAGEEFQIKFENNEIITMAAIKDVSPTAQAYATSNSASIISYYIGVYHVGARELSILENNKATNIKIMVAGQPYQFAVGKSESPKISKAAYCIQQ